MAAAIRLSQQHSCSFNHLVGVLQKVQRQVEAQRLRGLEINDEFEARRLHNGQVGGLLPLEYASSIDSYFSTDFGTIRAVTHQAAGSDEFAPFVKCRNPVMRGEGNQSLTDHLEK